MLNKIQYTSFTKKQLLVPEADPRVFHDTILNNRSTPCHPMADLIVVPCVAVPVSPGYRGFHAEM